MGDSDDWGEFLSAHPELEPEPYIPFVERASWHRRLFDVTVGEGLSWTYGALGRAQGGIDACMGRLCKAGWIS
jgi:hypothetical protein